MKKRIAFLLLILLPALIFAQKANDVTVIDQEGVLTSELLIETVEEDQRPCMYLMIVDKVSHQIYVIKAHYANDTEKQVKQSKMVELIMSYERNIFEDIEPKILSLAHKRATMYSTYNREAVEVHTYQWNN